MSVRSPRSRSLWPREHGAYVQLLVPVVTSLLATGVSWAAAAIAFGAGCAFLAAEPLRVVLGARGARIREVAGTRARTRLALLAAGAMTAGGIGLALAPGAALYLTLLLAPLAGFVIVAVRRGTVQTVPGECVAAITLAGAGAPVAVAGGMDARDALVIWFGWSLAYATTVIAVHHVIARHRRASSAVPARAAIIVALVSAVLAASVLAVPAMWFACPLAIVALIVFVWPPRATRLRAVGIAFLASSILSAVCAISASRATRSESGPPTARERTSGPAPS